MTLLESFWEMGLTLIPIGEKLRVRSREPLTEEARRIIQDHKADILRELASLPMPYLDNEGRLVIPKGCDPRYEWWRGGQSTEKTIQELRGGCNG